MQNFVKCSLCRKPFQSLGGKICPDCLRELDETFVKIRDYMYDHPGRFDVDRIHKEVEVSREMVIQLIREGRLETADSGDHMPRCPTCGKPTVGGKLCEECGAAMAKELNSTLPAPPPPEPSQTAYSKDSSRMHLHHGKDKK